MSEVINFRVDKKLKSEAQAIAKKMGLNLSDVLNVFLRGFVRDKKLDINLEEPSDWLLKELAEADEDIKRGRVSPMFSNAEDAIKWLDNKNRKYANRV
jgi:addiction module RelB/DinJ family antitoxin